MSTQKVAADKTPKFVGEYLKYKLQVSEIQVHFLSCDLMDHGVAYMKDKKHGFDYSGQDLDPRT